MSMHFLGPHFDIHTGGVDNMFPHHEDEIAQSVCATGHAFVNYWLHNEHLLVDGQKMAKSAGNFFTIRDLLAKGYTGREIRWLLIGAHYRQKLNFTVDGLAAGRTVLRRFDDFTRRLKEATQEPPQCGTLAAELGATCLAAFRAGLEDDLNTPVAIAALFDLMRDANRALDAGEIGGTGAARLLDVCRELDSVLAVLDFDHQAQVPPDILAKAADRQAARKARDFARADALRDELKALGWIIEDTPKGPRVVPAP